MALAYSQKRSMRAIVGVRMNEWMNKRINEVPSTHQDISECATFSFQVRLPSTRLRWIRHRKWFFESALQSGNFWIRYEPGMLWTLKNFLPGDVTRWKSYKSYKLQILVWSKKLFRTYSSSRLIGAGRAVESVFIRLSLFKIKFAPLSLLMNKLE